VSYAVRSRIFLSFLGTLLFDVMACVCVYGQAKDVPRHDFVGETLTVDVDVVDVFFNVKEKNKFVENLQKEDFELKETTHPQQIRYFSAESQTPLSLGVLIDTSDSEAAVLQKEHEVARRFFDQVLIAGDEGMVISFDSFVDVKQEFTGDHGVLVEAVGHARKEFSRASHEIDPGGVPRLRSTALFDSIVGSARYRFAQRSGRKAMIIITDGQDMGSRATARQAIEAALKSNTICYVLIVGDSRYMTASSYDGVERMKTLASETGGRVIPMDRKLKNLESSLLAIASELRHHYSIGYTPSDRAHDGDYRKISLKCRRGFKVQSRRGYYATHEPLDAEARNQVSASN